MRRAREGNGGPIHDASASSQIGKAADGREEASVWQIFTLACNEPKGVACCDAETQHIGGRQLPSSQ